MPPHSRLPVLAERPAPFQISTPLAFASSSGIADYYLVDAPLLMGGGEKMFNETLIPMRTALVWEPTQARPEALPNRQGQPLVFGFCNQAQKISHSLALAWAEILKALPEAQLALKCPVFNDPSRRFALQQMLQTAGVPLAQVRWEGYSNYAEHLGFFEQIDLLLDAMPFQGGVTTCDALWMGVPVLSVLVPGRVGNCFLLQSGQAEWLCPSLDAYVAKAIAVAQDPSALRALRPKVREAFDASPLCQGAAFTRELEQIYTDLWAGKYPIKQGAA
jgi:protein O-GlcNAc transferase